MFETVVGKRRHQTGSKREGNVSVWKQEKCSLFVTEQGEGCSSDHTYCFSLAPQQHPSVHEDSLGLAVLRGLQKMEVSLLEGK